MSKIVRPRSFVKVINALLYVFCIQSGSMVYAQQWPNEAQCLEALTTGQTGQITQGWCLVINQNKGNCIACHTFNVSPWPESLPTAGNIAPPLAAMVPRFPDTTLLRGIIEDASKFNPNTTMPPYLKHGILSAMEIDLIIKFLESI